MKLLMPILLLMFGWKALAYEVLEQFPPERYCLNDKAAFETIGCDAEAETDRSLTIGRAACDSTANVLRRADQKSLMILVNGVGEEIKLASSPGENQKVQNKIDQNVKNLATLQARNQVIAKLQRYETCDQALKEPLPAPKKLCDGPICGEPFPGANPIWVRDTYAAGGLPTDLQTGRYVGRCYLPEGWDPATLNFNIPGPAYLYYDAKAKKFEVFIVPKPDIPALNYFDYGDKFYDDADKYLHNWFGVQKAQEVSLSLVEQNVVFTFEWSVNLHLRQSQQYLTVLLEGLQLRPNSGGLLYAPVGFFSYCYFFNKVEPLKAH